MRNNWKLLALLTFGLAACGGPQRGGNKEVDCPLAVGESCSIRSNGGQISFNTESFRPGEEYAFVVLSRTPYEEQGSARAWLNWEAQPSSAPITTEEQRQRENLRQRIPQYRPNLYLQKEPGQFFRRANLALPDHSAIEANSTTSFHKHEHHKGEDHDETFIFHIPFQSDDEELESQNPHIHSQRFFVQSPDLNQKVGARRAFGRHSLEPGAFDLFFEKEIFGGLPEQNQRYYSTASLDALSSCLSETFPGIQDFLGRPIDVDDKNEVNILVTEFNGSRGRSTIGLFASIDRFNRRGKEDLPATNHSEVLYLSASQKVENLCSTVPHEYVHLLRWDATVLSKLSEKDRSDIRVAEKKKLFGEVPGLDEGVAHIVEELSGEANFVADHIYRFAQDPNGKSLSLGATGDNRFDASASRGFNTLLLYHVLALRGASLRQDDPLTQRFLAEFINSPETGYENLAKHVGLSEDQLFESFLREFSLSLLHEGYDSRAFVPSLEQDRNFQQGFVIEARNQFEKTEWRGAQILHPYLVDLPVIGQNSADQLKAEALAMRRYIVPDRIGEDASVSVSSDAGPYQLVVIRTK